MIDAQALVAAKTHHAIVPPGKAFFRLIKEPEGIVQTQRNQPLKRRTLRFAHSRARAVNQMVASLDSRVQVRRDAGVALLMGWSQFGEGSPLGAERWFERALAVDSVDALFAD